MASLFPKYPACFNQRRSISVKDIPQFREPYYYYNIPFHCRPCFVACQTLRHPQKPATPFNLPTTTPNPKSCLSQNQQPQSEFIFGLNEVANRLIITYSMINGTATTTAAISSTNIRLVPGNNRNSLDRFARAPASEGPYFASARMGERSAHLSRLSSQLNAMDAVLNIGR
jgi:hypothetical protein